MSQGVGRKEVLQERRTALVIGNSAYQKSPLVNPVNDAQAMAATLGSLGFTVTKIENASKSQMADAIRQFGDTIKLGGVGLFYFAGHGVQVNGENFLIPVDDDIQEKNQVATKGVEAKLVLQAMGNARNRLNVVILDACRNNPFAQSASRALVANGILTVGRARTVLAVSHPWRLWWAPSLPLRLRRSRLLLTAVGRMVSIRRTSSGTSLSPGSGSRMCSSAHVSRVRQETGGRQVPWENTSLEGDFYFVAPVAGSTVAIRLGWHRPPPQAGGQQASLQTNRSDTPPAKPARSPSGFSFSREEEKDRATRFGKDDEIRARLQAPVPKRYANDRLSSTLRRNRAPMDWSRRSAVRASRSWSISTCSRPA